MDDRSWGRTPNELLHFPRRILYITDSQEPFKKIPTPKEKGRIASEKICADDNRLRRRMPPLTLRNTRKGRIAWLRVGLEKSRQSRVRVVRKWFGH